MIDREDDRFLAIQQAVLTLDIAAVRSELAGCKSGEVKRYVNSDEILESNGGFTLLHLACMNPSKESVSEMVDLLLRSGVDVDAKTRLGVSSLSMLAAKGDAASVRILLDAGADAAYQDETGFTTLMYATSKRPDAGAWSETHEGRLSSIGLLVAAGADVQARDGKGLTVLHHAAMGDDESMFFALLEMGVDLECLSVDGKKALDYGSKDFVRLVNARVLSEKLLTAMGGEDASSSPSMKPSGFSL